MPDLMSERLLNRPICLCAYRFIFNDCLHDDGSSNNLKVVAALIYGICQQSNNILQGTQLMLLEHCLYFQEFSCAAENLKDMQRNNVPCTRRIEPRNNLEVKH